MTTLCLIALLLIVPTTHHAMEDIFSLEIVCDQPWHTPLHDPKVLRSCDISLENSEDNVPLEQIKNNELYTYDSSDFARLPKEICINILLKLALQDFLVMLTTDSIRKTLCSENIVRRFLLEKRYQENLPNYIPIYSHNFPIENQTIILELSTLLIIIAGAGYTQDFRILLNKQHILNYILEETRAYDALHAAAVEGQVGIVSQLVSHQLIKDRLTPEELRKISTLCEGNKDIKKLVRKKSLKDKIQSQCKSLFGIRY